MNLFIFLLLASKFWLVRSFDRIVKVTKLYACPGDNETVIPFAANTFKVTKSQADTIVLSLNLTIPRDLPAPITFHSHTMSCNVLTRTCDAIPPWDFPDACVILNMKFLGFLTQLQPPITKCPFARGVYGQSEMKIDMSPFKMIINTMGRKYTTQVSFGEPGPRTLFCMFLDYKIVRQRN